MLIPKCDSMLETQTNPDLKCTWGITSPASASSVSISSAPSAGGGDTNEVPGFPSLLSLVLPLTLLIFPLPVLMALLVTNAVEEEVVVEAEAGASDALFSLAGHS